MIMGRLCLKKTMRSKKAIALTRPKDWLQNMLSIADAADLSSSSSSSSSLSSNTTFDGAEPAVLDTLSVSDPQLSDLVDPMFLLSPISGALLRYSPRFLLRRLSCTGFSGVFGSDERISSEEEIIDLNGSDGHDEGFISQTFSVVSEKSQLASLGGKAELAAQSDISNGRSLKLISGSFYIPKDNELKPQGEDAHFICVEEHAFGVADGVGGWAKYGVDSGKYARELMINSVIAIQNEPNQGCIDPKRVLTDAFSNTKSEGASTASIVTLADQCLHCVNIGDSGFIVVRDGRIIYDSPTQQHYFNCPLQLGNSSRCDPPSLAEEFKVAVESGDVIVAGTDGLWDNLFKHEIIEDVIHGARGDMEPEQMAWMLAERALTSSQDKDAFTPFAVAARRAGTNYHGGKIDDITVIVSYIV